MLAQEQSLIEEQSARPHMPCVILPRLFTILLALSLLFGPLAMNRAMAAAPASSHAQMADDGHCAPEEEGNSDPAMKDGCCAATSAVAPQASVDQLEFARLPAIAANSTFDRGVLSEISTPPPRPA